MAEATRVQLPKWNATLQRIAARGESVSFAHVLVTILALPFYLIGLVVGFVWLVCVLAWGGVCEGFGQLQAMRPQRLEE